MTGNRALYRLIHEEREEEALKAVIGQRKKKDFLTAKILKRERERER